MDKNVPTDKLQRILRTALQIIHKYDWLINAYILDFYVDEHWSKLPHGWRQQLETLPIEHLNQLLDYNAKVNDKLLPLELLALRQLLRDLCISRERMKTQETLPQSPLLTHPKLKNIFRKCVKPKKLHEVECMAAICKRSCLQVPVDFVVDFGAGQGHLARILGYGFGIRVCCLEMQPVLNEQARLIDLQFELAARKHLSSSEQQIFQRPTHITLKLTADMQSSEFLATLSNALQLPHNNFRFGIIGLHPCGDLAAILMRLFLHCEQAKFLNFVSCCYMKLTTKEAHINDNHQGYPLSGYAQKMQTNLSHLSYEAREISCHAAESYCDRLAKGDYEHLKVHSFRAATERILIKHWPDLKHCGLRSVKHVPGMSFEDYFYKAVQGLEAFELPSSALQTTITENDLKHWKRIVIFYTLRLMFAPLVESVILYDRALFLQEQECEVEINAIFDPRLSPRNHITSAMKRS